MLPVEPASSTTSLALSKSWECACYHAATLPTTRCVLVLLLGHGIGVDAVVDVSDAVNAFLTDHFPKQKNEAFGQVVAADAAVEKMQKRHTSTSFVAAFAKNS